LKNGGKGNFFFLITTSKNEKKQQENKKLTFVAVKYQLLPRWRELAACAVLPVIVGTDCKSAPAEFE
jgi:hypothetical protein